MEPLILTRELALDLLTKYEFFEAHEKATIAGFSSETFEIFLKILGRELWRIEDISQIVERLRTIAEGKEEGAIVPGNIQDLVNAYENWERERVAAQENTSSDRIATLQVAGALLTAKTEALVAAQMQTGGAKIETNEIPEEIPSRATPRLRPTPPVPKQQVAEPTKDTRALREAQLLLRVSYLRPSVAKKFFTQLGTLSPFRLLNVVGGKAYANSHPLEAGVQSLLLQGVTITLLREAITSLKEQAPGISLTDPRLRTLEEIITAMETYQSSHPGNYAKFERSAAEKVEVYVAAPEEKAPPTPGKILRLRSVFDAAGKFQFLRIDTLSLKKGVRALPGIVGRVVSYPFLYTARVFFGKPAGGILHTLGGPRAVAVRETTFGVQRGVANFTKGAFRQLGSFVSDVFTRPALGWLRWGLAGGFGVGALTLPFPFNFIFGGASGSLLVAQGAHSTQGLGSTIGAFGRRLSSVRPLSAAGGLSGFRWIAIFIAPVVLIFVLTPLFNINTAQSTFLGVGGRGFAPGGLTQACFTFNEGWTDENEVKRMTEAISFVAKSTVYASKLCEKGNITLQRSYATTTKNKEDEIVPITWGGFVPDANTITIYNLGVGNLDDAIYTLAHETGHIYQGRYDYIYTDQFLVQVNPPTSEAYLETYAFGFTQAEDFAETFGLYVVWQKKTFKAGKIDMPTKYRKHYDFAKNNIFGGVEY